MGGMGGKERGGERGGRVEGEKGEILRGKFWCRGCGGVGPYKFLHLKKILKKDLAKS